MLNIFSFQKTLRKKFYNQKSRRVRVRFKTYRARKGFSVSFDSPKVIINGARFGKWVRVEVNDYFQGLGAELGIGWFQLAETKILLRYVQFRFVRSS